MPGIDSPWSSLFWPVAVLVTVYYGVRGVLITVRAARDEDLQRSREAKPPLPAWHRLLVHYVHAFILNAAGSFAGFLAIFLAAGIYHQVGPEFRIETGTGVLLVFLGLLAITGVTGTLPELLYRGGVFGPKSTS